MQKLKKISKLIVINLVVFLVILAMVEVCLIFVFRNPVAQSGPLAKIYLRYHINYERKIVQFLPECAQYDNGRTYTLKPGRCSFSNREFAVTKFCVAIIIIHITANKESWG